MMSIVLVGLVAVETIGLAMLWSRYNSIKADIDDLEVNIGTDVYYAPFVHDGTYKMEARPFLESAAETVLDDIEDRIADAITRLL